MGGGLHVPSGLETCAAFIVSILLSEGLMELGFLGLLPNTIIDVLRDGDRH